MSDAKGATPAIISSLQELKIYSMIEQYQGLLEVSEAIISHCDLSELFQVLAARLSRIVDFDYLNVMLHDADRNVMRLRLWATPSGTGPKPVEEMTVEEAPSGWVWRMQQPLVVDDIETETRFPKAIEIMRGHGIKCFCILPLTTAARRLGALGFGCERVRAYGDADMKFMGQVAKQVAIAVDNALAYGQITELKEKLAQEKLYLEEEVRTEYNFTEIVGHSDTLKRTLKAVETVAPTDSVVLIQGETGTGKELIARALHDLSSRRERTLVKLNCAAIPTGLLESELFGHEKGAFTGAVERRVGRFEVAHNGTLFLDEVGDIPLELQPKLLRVLQEQEFERLGSSRTIRVDVRVIAATNRDLAQMVAAGEFRADLYYRLNVFPVRIPPLRERPEDIPLLVTYFTQHYARRMNKRIESIPAEAMNTLQRHTWAGNVRELENFIERAVIITRGSHLEIPIAELETDLVAGGGDKTPPPARLASMQEIERKHIEEVLRHTGGQIGGTGGAAEILGLPVSTLRSRMKRLGIRSAR